MSIEQIGTSSFEVGKINEQRLWRHAEVFSRSTRLSGSPEELVAFQYAQSELDKSGFRTTLLKHKGYVSWPGKATLQMAGTAYSCITHAMGANRPDGVVAQLIDMTTVSPSAWGSVNVSGQAVIVEGLASPSLVKVLSELDVAAAIFVNQEHTYEMIVSTVWGNPDIFTVSQLPELPVVSINRETWSALRNAIVDMPEPKAKITTNVTTGWRDLPLLEARLDGPLGTKDFVLFSGHIDAWHLGAMDNGAANATMLEVAAQLANRQAELRRGLRVLFWSGHSHGRYAGSAWYADQHFEEIQDHCVLHVNIDSVGGRGADDLGFAPVMAEAVGLASRAVATVTNTPFEGVRSERAGDQSFYGHGVTSLFMGLSEQPAPATPEAVSTESHAMFGRGRMGFGWWWHTTEDTLDKLDPHRLARDAGVYLAALMEACGSEVLPLRFSATVQEIRKAIEDSMDFAGRLADASRTFLRLERLAFCVERLEALIEDNQIDADLANRSLLALGRSLVPINYVKGSIYEHDAALKQGPVPSLDVASLAPSLDESGQLRLAVVLRRRLNRIDRSLRDALDAIEPVVESVTA